MLLQNILENITIEQSSGNTEINVLNVTMDSREVKEGSLFVAVRGTQVDGHDYIKNAVDLGASVVVCETFPGVVSDTTFVIVKDTSSVVGEIASAFYGYPSKDLKLVGVTGTNGKTTIASLLYTLTSNLGYVSGLLSTVNILIGEEEFAATHTTPDAISINAYLAKMVEAGCEYCFMEVSSHAIHQNRIAGLDFDGGIFTNLTRDHLDYHETFAAYRDAKKKFFDNLAAGAFALTNKDDKNGLIMQQNTAAKKVAYSVKSVSDYKFKVIEKSFEGMQIEADGSQLYVQFVGEFNAYNLCAVYGAALELGLDREEVLVQLTNLTPVTGRFEIFRSPNGVVGIVDYAHSPDAVKNLLDAVNNVQNADNRVITVVGAGGNRDKGKRPLMAECAVKASSMVVLTSDNPRFEDPDEIIKDMLKGVDSTYQKNVLAITDRYQAIKTAAMVAKPGDVIVIAGKGHEDYQEVKGVKHHFDDREVIQQVFRELMN